MLHWWKLRSQKHTDHLAVRLQLPTFKICTHLDLGRKQEGIDQLRLGTFSDEDIMVTLVSTTKILYCVRVGGGVKRGYLIYVNYA